MLNILVINFCCFPLNKSFFHKCVYTYETVKNPSLDHTFLARHASFAISFASMVFSTLYQIVIVAQSDFSSGARNSYNRGCVYTYETQCFNHIRNLRFAYAVAINGTAETDYSELRGESFSLSRLLDQMIDHKYS